MLKWQIDDWKSLDGWDNIYNVLIDHPPFEIARETVRALKLKTQQEWIDYCKSGDKPHVLPNHPFSTYKNHGWVNWGDWLGTDKVLARNIDFTGFHEARMFAHSLGLRNQKEWFEYSKSGNKPFNIPTTPHRVYKNQGWAGFGDWLGNYNPASRDVVYLSFTEARNFARSLGLKTIKEWSEYWKANRPKNIPAAPHNTYKTKGWINNGDWLGTGTIACQNRIYLNFDEAKLFARSLGLRNQKEWRDYTKSGDKPSNIPAYPEESYLEWTTWGDWLGTTTVANQCKNFLPFNTAREIARSWNVIGQKEWRHKKPYKAITGMPSSPARTYKGNGWCGWKDWLSNA